MILTTKEALILLAFIALTTFATRATPFFLFPPHKKTPAFVEYLGKMLPYATIGMLVVYCLKDVSLFSGSHGIPEAIAMIAISLVHIWKHNILLSVGGGTLFYMFLVQYVF
ncbi:MAG: branched-chain amino acid transporter permease [Clostridia bacterium]|nr:branched-chain amino acid transporter permease [Clostridia bacterium]